MQQHHDVHGVFPSNGGWDGKQSIRTTDGRRTHVSVTEFQFSLTFYWGVGQTGRAPRDQTGSWAYALLPFLEQQAIQQHRTWTEPVRVYVCPSRRAAQARAPADDQYGRYQGGGWKWAPTDYAANALVVPNRPFCRRLADVRDGASQTALAGEKSVSPVNYATGTWYWDEPFFTGGSGGTQRGFGTRPGEGTAVVRDAPDMGFAFRYSWGSAHPAGAQFLFADGAVRLVSYGTPTVVVSAVLTPAGGEVVPDYF
jgi:prepilin-type processing-associated H-X9-DG protein